MFGTERFWDCSIVVRIAFKSPLFSIAKQLRGKVQGTLSHKVSTSNRRTRCDPQIYAVIGIFWGETIIYPWSCIWDGFDSKTKKRHRHKCPVWKSPSRHSPSTPYVKRLKPQKMSSTPQNSALSSLISCPIGLYWNPSPYVESDVISPRLFISISPRLPNLPFACPFLTTLQALLTSRLTHLPLPQSLYIITPFVLSLLLNQNFPNP